MYQTPNIYGYFFERQILCDSETCHTGRLAAALCFMLIKTRAAGMRLPRVPRLSTLRLCEWQLFAVRLTSAPLFISAPHRTAAAAKAPFLECPCRTELSQSATLVKICSVCISYRKNFTVHRGSCLLSIRLVNPVINIIVTVNWPGPGVTKHEQHNVIIHPRQ